MGESLTLVLVALWAAQLPVLLGQDSDIYRLPELQYESTGLGLLAPLDGPPGGAYTIVRASPPAIVPTYPPAIFDREYSDQLPAPPVIAYQDVFYGRAKPKIGLGICRPQTLVVTSRDVVVSTVVSVSEALVTSTIVHQLTVTRNIHRPSTHTSYVTVQGAVQTRLRTVNRTIPSTVFSTATKIYTETVTSTISQTSRSQTRAPRRQRMRPQTVTSTTTKIYTETVTSTNAQTSTQVRTGARRRTRPSTVTSTTTKIYTETVTSTSAQARCQATRARGPRMRESVVTSTTTKVYTETVTSTSVQTKLQARPAERRRIRPSTVTSTTTVTFTRSQAWRQAVRSCAGPQYVTVTQNVSEPLVQVSTHYQKQYFTSTQTQYLTTTVYAAGEVSPIPRPVSCRVTYGCPGDQGSPRVAQDRRGSISHDFHEPFRIEKYYGPYSSEHYASNGKPSQRRRGTKRFSLG